MDGSTGNPSKAPRRVTGKLAYATEATAPATLVLAAEDILYAGRTARRLLAARRRQPRVARPTRRFWRRIARLGLVTAAAFAGRIAAGFARRILFASATAAPGTAPSGHCQNAARDRTSSWFHPTVIGTACGQKQCLPPLFPC